MNAWHSNCQIFQLNNPKSFCSKLERPPFSSEVSFPHRVIDLRPRLDAQTRSKISVHWQLEKTEQTMASPKTMRQRGTTFDTSGYVNSRRTAKKHMGSFFKKWANTQNFAPPPQKKKNKKKKNNNKQTLPRHQLQAVRGTKFTMLQHEQILVPVTSQPPLATLVRHFRTKRIVGSRPEKSNPLLRTLASTMNMCVTQPNKTQKTFASFLGKKLLPGLLVAPSILFPGFG